MFILLDPDSENCYFIVLDCAYLCTRKCLVPFKEPQKHIAHNDAFNFYLSQLRIKIEQAFGFLTNKWRILRRSLGSNVRFAVKLLNACARLHNFCINERISVDQRDEDLVMDEEETVFVSTNNTRLGYVPSDVEELSQNRRNNQRINENLRNQSSVSQFEADYSLRDQIVETRIIRNNWSRPEYNLRRNANRNLEETSTGNQA